MSKPSLSADLERIRAEIQSVPIDHVSLDFCRSLLGSLHYIDPYFPPIDYSIYGPFPPASATKYSIKWCRPTEFLKGSIEMFQGGIEKSDIKQGELGDCWLMCSLCALASHPHYITKIFLNPEHCPQNFYRLRLCKDAEWQNITVDDLIPCKKSTGEPIFSQNNGNELWVIILEKAYAKLYGSYLALKGGMAQESFEDLTGCPAFTHYFDKIPEKIQSGEFWRNLLMWKSSNQCLLAATSASARESKGIVASHYYTIINIEEFQGNKLLNLRNPWGSFEWNGAWSDNSREWTESMIKRLKPVFDSSDGAFWMSFEDFLQNFQRVVVGRLGFNMEIRLKTLVKINAIYGAFPEEYFKLTLTEPSIVVIELHQEDERAVGVEMYRPYIDLGLLVIEEGFGFVDYSPISQQKRESQLELNLNAGTYIIVGMSGGNIFRKEKKLKKTPFLTETGEFHPIFQSTLKDIFRKYDKDLDQVMNCSQFLDFTSRIGVEFDEKRFYSVITNKYTSSDMGLTLQGFYELFYVALDQYGEDTVRGWMTCLGYDEDLYSIESRAIIASVHSYSAHTKLIPCQMTEEMLMYCWSELCKNKGELCSKLSSLCIYTLKHEEGVSILIQNTGHEKMIQIDTSESENINYCIRGPIMEIEVPINSWVIAEHLQCKKDESRFSYSLSAKLI